jgi:hypothetical protein
VDAGELDRAGAAVELVDLALVDLDQEERTCPVAPPVSTLGQAEAADDLLGRQAMFQDQLGRHGRHSGGRRERSRRHDRVSSVPLEFGSRSY